MCCCTGIGWIHCCELKLFHPTGWFRECLQQIVIGNIWPPQFVDIVSWFKRVWFQQSKGGMQCWSILPIGFVNGHPTMHYIGIPKHTQSMKAFWPSISGNFSENCIVGMLLLCHIQSWHAMLVNTSYWQLWHQPSKRKVGVFVIGAWFLLINVGVTVFS